MDNTINSVLGMMSAAQFLQKGINLTGDGSKTTGSDFQKLMEKAQASQPDSQVEQPAKTEQPAAANKKEDAPVQEEDPLARVKKLAEQGYAVTQPNIGCIQIDLETGETIGVYQPGEYVLAYNGEDVQVIPTAGLEPWQQLQLQQLLDGAQTMDVSDPEADAILEATAPGADNSPAAMLEKVTAEQFGKEIQQATGENQPQQDDEDQVVITDASQTNQFIFRDVKNIPVKVGETELPQPTQEPNVAQQVDSQIAQALQQGESMVRIQLTPENLGSVTVEISQSADGILRIALSAHSSETRGLLERHAADLQGLVSSRTQQEVQVDVQRGQESQQNQNQQNYDGHNGHAHDRQEHRRQQQEHTGPQDFMQQLRLGLIPADGEF